MRWLLTPLITRRGLKVAKPRVVATVTLESDLTGLHAFESGRLVGEIIPHNVEFHRDGVVVKGVERFGERGYYYEEWWLRPEPMKEDEAWATNET